MVTTFIAVRYSVPMMTPGGAIVCISSTAAKMPFNGLVGYGTAKAGWRTSCRLRRRNWAPRVSASTRYAPV